MSSFTGVSVVTDGKHCTTTAIDAGTDSRYHHLLVKGYSLTVQEKPCGKSIISGPFMVGGHKWCIEYFPNGEDQSLAGFISFYIIPRCGSDDVSTEEAVKVHCVFSFVDQVEYQKPMYIRATQLHSLSREANEGVYDKFSKREVLNHVKDDCFTIRCDIIVCDDLNPQQDAGTLSDIGQHFKILLQDKVGSDVTFEVSSKTFPAHRCVLAARSQVFKAQFFGPMSEGITSGVIQIKDIDANVFAALLSFIYTDSFPEMEEEEGQDEEEEEVVEGQEEEVSEPDMQWLQGLFVAADRYDIQHLKFLCEKKLSEHIGVSSVASTLVLAEQHQCHRLKEACFLFIQVQSPKCLDKVMETDGWEHIRTTYPSILKELFAKVASNQKNDKKRKL